MGIDADDAYTAYCLDVATGEFGRSLEGALKDVEGKNKKEIKSKSARLLMKWLGGVQRYRDPASTGQVSRS